jgi:hypothetical protein
MAFSGWFVTELAFLPDTVSCLSGGRQAKPHTKVRIGCQGHIMLSKQAQFPIPSYLSKSLETLCDLRVMLSHGQGLELTAGKAGRFTYFKAGAFAYTR